MFIYYLLVSVTSGALTSMWAIAAIFLSDKVKYFLKLYNYILEIEMQNTNLKLFKTFYRKKHLIFCFDVTNDHTFEFAKHIIIK